MSHPTADATILDLVLARAEGTRFTVGLARASGEGADAPVVLIAPAMGMRTHYYRDLVAALAAAGVHAAVAEQRGHEASGGRRPGRDYDYGYAELVEDLAEAAQAVRRELPQAPLVILGHSLGGQIATAYAGAGHPRPDGLVLMAASTPYWPHWGPRLRVVGHLLPAIARVLGHYPGGRLGFAGRESRTLMRDWGRLARDGRLPVGEEGLAALRLPVLAVSIEGDELGVPAAVDALAAKLPAASLTRLHLDVDGVDHFRWAKRPDVVVPLIVDWLRATGLSR